MDLDLSPHAAKNRDDWNASSDAYQTAHAAQLARIGAAWGVWQIPESELRVLPEVTGRDVLELGCGAAHWAIALARDGARVVGLDLSERQLAYARANVARAGVDVSLVHASAEKLPFADASFDMVFCDHGAMSFADPYATVPEVSRVLRDGGTLAFSAASIFHLLCDERANDGSWRLTETLQRDYFAIRRREDESNVDFALPYGDWIRLFRANAFSIEDLIELRAPQHAETTYDAYAPHAWACRWPAEQIWKLRRETR